MMPILLFLRFMRIFQSQPIKAGIVVLNCEIHLKGYTANTCTDFHQNFICLSLDELLELSQCRTTSGNNYCHGSTFSAFWTLYFSRVIHSPVQIFTIYSGCVYCIPGRKSGILRIQYSHAAAAEISFWTR